MTKDYKFDFEVKGQHRNATYRPMVIHMCAKYGKPMSIKKSYEQHTITFKNPINLTLRSKVNVQDRIWILNVRDTSPRGDTPMCQIW